MFETYDTNLKAYVERTGQYYDTVKKAWVDVPSAMTYDTTERAWVERLNIDNFFTIYTCSFTNGGGYVVSADKESVTFTFKTGVATDHASIVWEGNKPVTNSVLMGEYSSNDSSLNPDVYMYYQGTQVKTSKLKTQTDNLFAIPYDGSVDKIVINIPPSSACTFTLTGLWFGKNLKFEF